ncbi:hypothetical protein [Stenotrophomonas sp. S39]|uniref:hypothetical protein n=1 Tax=Stenotrophomonas sp. S39 TaxID=2767451 RepID=UPI00190A42E9|nr:hypothetical protein [Stenotrophomonas sp. S39]MBK0052999.1 hypothetical protein [Stenotrophomonas sp. S39]
MSMPQSVRNWFSSKFACHIYSFLVILVIAIACYFYDKDLFGSLPKTVGSVSAFLTVYGVIFALIELVRTRTAAELAEQRVTEVVQVVEDLITAREITECQIAVESALDGISRNEDISARYVVKIIRLYSQVFPDAMLDEQSPHRSNRSILETYRYVKRVSDKSKGPVQTQKALMSISGHLAEMQGHTKRGKENAQ